MSLKGKTAIERIFKELRPDVKDFLVRELPEDIKIKNEENKYRRYEEVKRGLSRVCGWDALPENQDSQYYDIAMDYIREVLVL